MGVGSSYGFRYGAPSNLGVPLRLIRSVAWLLGGVKHPGKLERAAFKQLLFRQ